MMELNKKDINKRLPLWIAFSDLFLDTEITDSCRKHIASKIKESPFNPEEVINILWLEVFPAVCDNLRDVAGEWAGFNEQWLTERILNVKSGKEEAFSNYGMLNVEQVLAITENEWEQCCRYLPKSYNLLKRPPNNKINPKYFK
jgi:hypothetical protein